MKKTWVIICLVLAMLLCACQAEDKDDRNEKVGKVVDTQDDTDIVDDIADHIDDDTDTDDDDDTNDGDTNDGDTNDDTDTIDKNEFFNDENNIWEEGKVTIRPRHMYWDGDVLVAECFVINGLDTTLSNIVVEDLDFANNEGVFADAYFGLLEGLSIESRHHALWTFYFEGDTLMQTQADLGHIYTHSSISYNY